MAPWYSFLKPMNGMKWVTRVETPDSFVSFIVSLRASTTPEVVLRKCVE
jgi:hypothetical protein